MSRPIRILVVDDDSADRELATRALEKGLGNVQLDEADSRETFLAALDKTSYDVIVSDFAMRGFNGLDVIDLVRGQGLETRIILLTGTGTEEVAVEAMKRGVSDYVLKSVEHIRRLPSSVEHVLERAEAEKARKRAEEKLRESEAKLVHAARLSIVGEMAAALAHEINQPLCAIKNFSEACTIKLESRQDDSLESVLDHLQQISNGATRAHEIIRRMNNFCRKTEPKYEPLDLNEVIRESISFLAIEARHFGVEIEFLAGEKLSEVLGDEIQIQQVMVNLLRNACESMAEVPRGQRRIIVRTLARNELCEAQVEDTGAGLSGQQAEKVFETFFTTKETGLGMGLAVSRTIVEAHGGKLWAESNPQRGSTFHFTLPTSVR